jgi:2',3'-cyclic-nucleotide 2'-phosphodiesterase (5'-nucleotidase family)
MSKTFNFFSLVKPNIIGSALFLLLVCAAGGLAQQPESRSATPPATNKQTPGAPAEVRARVSETQIDASIPNDPAVDKILGPYAGRVRALDVVIGKLDGELRKGGMGGGSLGNFITDGIRYEGSVNLGRPVTLVVLNPGGMRKNTIEPGELRIVDIFELLPFENKLVALEVSGTQLMNVLKAVVSTRTAQAGARLRYRIGVDKKPELASARLVEENGRESEIDPTGSYRIITIDYLLSVGGGLSSLREANSTKPLGITIRDALIEYVKAETAATRTIKVRLDGRFMNVGPRPETGEEPPQ